MIRYIDDSSGLELQALKDFCRKTCVGTKIASTLISYDTKYDFAKFWVQLADDNTTVTAAICNFYGSVQVEASESSNLIELNEFLKVIGYSNIQSNIPLEENFEACGYIMKLACGIKNTAEITRDEYDIKEQCDYRTFYEFLSKNFPGNINTSYEDWLVDFSHRVRHETATYAMLAVNDKYVASAAVLAISDECALVGAISTDENCRGKHYAHTLIKYFAEKYRTYTVFVMCKPDKEGLYLKAGFENCGSFYEV